MLHPLRNFFFRDFRGFSEVLPHNFWTSCRVSSGPGILNYIFDSETSLLQWGILAVHWKIWKMIKKHDFIKDKVAHWFSNFPLCCANVPFTCAPCFINEISNYPPPSLRNSPIAFQYLQARSSKWILASRDRRLKTEARVSPSGRGAGAGGP